MVAPTSNGCASTANSETEESSNVEAVNTEGRDMVSANDNETCTHISETEIHTYSLETNLRNTKRHLSVTPPVNSKKISLQKSNMKADANKSFLKSVPSLNPNTTMHEFLQSFYDTI